MDGKHPERSDEPEESEVTERFASLEPPPMPELLRKPVPDPKHGKDGEGSGLSDMSKAWGVALGFMFTIIGCALAGYFADRWQHTGTRYSLIGLVVGFTIALVRIIRKTMADEKKEQERRRSGGSGFR